MVRSNRLAGNRQGTVPVRVTVPMADFGPGKYECQLNVIDEFGRKFGFPRSSFAVLAGVSK